MIPEIVSPGGSWEKAVVAARFGADAVYVWVPFLSLRMRQNKVKDFEGVKKVVDDLHELWKKVYLTINIFPRNSDIKIIEGLIERIWDLGADAVIFSDPGVFVILKKYLKNSIKYHLSTQTNTLNYEAVRFWGDVWVDRIVLARELNVKEIIDIKKKVPQMQLEAFVHGAMCMTYSWRCLLWEHFSGRDGNKWECSHVCRYKYNVYLEEEKRPWKLFQLEEDQEGSHIMSSKDLCTIEKCDQLMEAIDAWKIEWRSKSEFYVGCTTKAYAHVRDCISTWKKPDQNIIGLLETIPHRYYWDGFLFNDIKSQPDGEEVITTTKDRAWPIVNVKYVWVVLSDSVEKDWKKYFKLVPKQTLQPGDEIKSVNTDGVIKTVKITGILDSDSEVLERATCNMKYIYICGEWVGAWDLLYD